MQADDKIGLDGEREKVAFRNLCVRANFIFSLFLWTFGALAFCPSGQRQRKGTLGDEHGISLFMPIQQLTRLVQLCLSQHYAASHFAEAARSLTVSSLVPFYQWLKLSDQ
jgi:hypothetical protein